MVVLREIESDEELQQLLEDGAEIVRLPDLGDLDIRRVSPDDPWEPGRWCLAIGEIS